MTEPVRVGSANVGAMTAPTYVDLTGAAKIAGIQYRTMRNYHQIAKRNRRLAEKYNDPSFIKPGDLPAPDDIFGGRTPVWLESTIEQWMADRPGRGVGGGRPMGYSPIKDDKEDEQE